jgi:hypothetical protein
MISTTIKALNIPVDLRNPTPYQIAQQWKSNYDFLNTFGKTIHTKKTTTTIEHYKIAVEQSGKCMHSQTLTLKSIGS